MSTISVSLANSVVAEVAAHIENLMEYVGKGGKVEEGSNAYKCGMRDCREVIELIDLFPSPNGKRQTIKLDKVKALVVKDRVLFSYQIARDNAEDGDVKARRLAMYCASAMKDIDAAIRNADNGVSK